MSVNGASNRKVQPVFAGFGAQNQNHQREQNQQGNGGQKKGDGSIPPISLSKEFPFPCIT